MFFFAFALKYYARLLVFFPDGLRFAQPYTKGTPVSGTVSQSPPKVLYRILFVGSSARCFTKKNGMKKLALYISAGSVCLIALMGADYRTKPVTQNKKTCTGYTIIEFDKGIDCHGDTIRLVRKNGFAQRVID